MSVPRQGRRCIGRCIYAPDHPHETCVPETRPSNRAEHRGHRQGRGPNGPNGEYLAICFDCDGAEVVV